MSIAKYIEQTRTVNENLLRFLEKIEEEEGSHDINIFRELKTRDNSHEIRLFLRILLQIYNNHGSNSNLYNKVEQILKFFKDKIQQFYSNSEIFDIFASNKRILLFLIKEKMMIFDKYIFNKITTNNKYIDAKYPQYFVKEIKPFMNSAFLLQKNKLIEELKNDLPENHEINRENGVNEYYICKLIRLDLVKDFIVYVNKTNYPLKSIIMPSIYETNPFLIKKQKEITLIKYAAFYGSIQIFQYLILNGVCMDSSLWPYVIHSNNQELFRILENEKFGDSNLNLFFNCFDESIKCHHNSIANYIKENWLNESKRQSLFFFKYYNFEFIELIDISMIEFCFLCKYNYYDLVKLLLKDGNLNVNQKIIFKSFN